MGGFADFVETTLDDTIFDIIGDDIVLEFPNGDTVDIRAPFEYRFEKDEFGARMPSTFPILDDVARKDVVHFENWEDLVVIYRGIRYSVDDFYQKHDTHYTAVLRSERI